MNDELQREEETIERELEEFLPRRGDRLFVQSAAGARLDPVGFTAPGKARSPVGRWQLYSSGFLHGGNRLVEGTSGAPHEDELIYPILALYRHHLELQLKWVIRFGADDETLREWITARPDLMEKWKGLVEKPPLEKWALERLSTCLNKEHGLRHLWNTLTAIYPRFGVWASKECTKACSELLFELDEQDANSQASRYPEDTRGNQMLTRLDIIDLPTLKLGIQKASHYFGTVIEQIGEDRDWEAGMESW